jgi:hypothetical protein
MDAMTLEAAAIANLKAQIEFLARSIDRTLEANVLKTEWTTLVRLKTDNLDVLNGLLLRKGGEL